MKIAVFPGSFDPITIGHLSIIERASSLFDEIIIAIGVNSQKKYMFELSQRKQWINEAISHLKNVSVDTYQGLTVDYCSGKKANYILRGLRNTNDFEFEKSIAQMNLGLNPNIESVFLMTEAKYSAINSSIVRDILKNGGDASSFLPPNIKI